MKFALASRRVVLPDGVRPATVVVEDGRIVEVREGINQAPAALHGIPIQDLGELVIAPGVIDAHVHINEPGHTDWEGFETATRAAAAGGVTTLVDMPLNNLPVTTTTAALETKRNAAAGKCRVDVGFYGGVVPENAAEIEPLLQSGVLGMKAFLCHSGLDEFPNAQLTDLQAAAMVLKKYNRPLLVHAELLNSPAPQPKIATRYADYLATRPPQWETDAIKMLIELCRTSGCCVHIVHLANADAMPLVKAAKNAGLPLTVETCPHYLHFAADATESLDAVELVMELESGFDFSIADLTTEHFQRTGKGIPDGDTRFKSAPPIRERRHQERLWIALQMGLIDTIGSDHSPCPPEMKRLESGNFMAAWGGIASLQLTLPVVWTGARRRGIELHKVFEWLSVNPARLVGLQHCKGRIAAGFDADLILFDPEAQWIVRGAQLHHRHKLTPYDSEELIGQVQRTYLRGELVFRAPEFVGEPMGRLLWAPG